MDKLARPIARLNGAISTLCITGLTITVIAQVIYRKVLNQSLSWTDEFGAFMLVWIALFGAVEALYDKKHLAIDVAVSKLRGPAKHIATIIANICILVFLLVLFWYALPMVSKFMNINTISIPIPKSYIYMAIPFTSACSIIIIIDAIIKEFKLLRGKGWGVK